MRASLKTLQFCNKRYGLVELSTETPAEPLEIARTLTPPMDIDIAFDVSGSMMPNMRQLQSTLGALLDMSMDCTVSVGVFDHEYTRVLQPTVVSAANLAELKTIKLINRQGYTNLQDTLQNMLQRPGVKILCTDGLANNPPDGLHTSAELSNFARTQPHFASSTIHTLGDIARGSDLNSELLKNLALESGGIFKLTSEQEGIPSFLGDVFAAHYYTRFSSVTTSLPECTLLSQLGVKGCIVRSDMPTCLVYEIKDGATFQLKLKGWDVAKRVDTEATLDLEETPANKYDMLKIIGCAIVAPMLNNKYPVWSRDHAFAHADLLGLKSLGPDAASLVITAERYIERRNHENAHGYAPQENSQDSLGAYNYGSSGGGDVTSPQLINLRAAALAQSQSQGNPEPTSGSITPHQNA
jgi:hypothetical protein